MQAKLVPTEEITIVVEVLAGKDVAAYNKLSDVSKSHLQFIQDSVKQPVMNTLPCVDNEEVIQEVVEVRVTTDSVFIYKTGFFGIRQKKFVYKRNLNETNHF